MLFLFVNYYYKMNYYHEILLKKQIYFVYFSWIFILWYALFIKPLAFQIDLTLSGCVLRAESVATQITSISLRSAGISTSNSHNAQAQFLWIKLNHLANK